MIKKIVFDGSVINVSIEYVIPIHVLNFVPFR